MGGLLLSRNLRIALFGDAAWAAESLRRLHGAGHDVVGVFLRTRPTDGSLRHAADELGIPTFEPARINDPAEVERLRALKPDLGVSVSYDQIFRRPVLEAPPLGMLNFHAGKLPFYRGRNVINWALINGERELGLTAHFVDDGIDTGDIVLQRTVPIGWCDTYADVLDRAVTHLPPLVEEAVALAAEGELERHPQPAWGTYFAARRPGDEWLDWTDTGVNLHNKVRAITRPGPGARTRLDGQEIIVWRAYCDPAWPRYLATPGEVVGRRGHEGVLVKTGDSVLLVHEVQLPGAAPAVPAWPIGTRLGQRGDGRGL
jgi:methionyl-tRNA formyltransferase